MHLSLCSTWISQRLRIQNEVILFVWYGFLAAAPSFFSVCFTTSECRNSLLATANYFGIKKMAGNSYTQVEWILSHAVSSALLLSSSVLTKSCRCNLSSAKYLIHSPLFLIYVEIIQIYGDYRNTLWNSVTPTTGWNASPSWVKYICCYFPSLNAVLTSVAKIFLIILSVL